MLRRYLELSKKTSLLEQLPAAVEVELGCVKGHYVVKCSEGEERRVEQQQYDQLLDEIE